MPKPPKIYYNDRELSPVPVVNIDYTPVYIGDIIATYAYTVTLNGYALSEELKNPDTEEEQSLSFASISKVIDKIKDIKEIFSVNGSTLKISNSNNTELIKAVGGTLQSLTFEPGNWSNYSRYTCIIEFNELTLVGDTASCVQSYLNSNSISKNLIDIEKYKISEVNDSWVFSVEDSLYNYISEINNSVINISYNINVVGKNYFNTEKELSPAWIQAKIFAQNRLHDQVNQLESILAIDGSSCAPESSLSSIGSYKNGMAESIKNSYGIFNETLSCSCSEANGEFSLRYNAILKHNQINQYDGENVLHAVIKTKTETKDGSNKNISIKVEGNIIGLCEGGLVQTLNNGNFSIPKNGSLLISKNKNSKYKNAYAFLTDKIMESDFQKLKDDFRTSELLNITEEELEIPSAESCNSKFLPTSINLTKDYLKGTIDYSVEYNANDICSNVDGNIYSISVDIEPAKPVYAEHIIPDFDHIVQDMSTKTSHKITVKAVGKIEVDTCITPNNINQLLIDGPIAPKVNVPLPSNAILIDKRLDNDLLKQTYNYTLVYLCHKGKCDI